MQYDWELQSQEGDKLADVAMLSDDTQVDPKTGRNFRTFKIAAEDYWIEAGHYILSKSDGEAFSIHIPESQMMGSAIAGSTGKIR